MIHRLHRLHRRLRRWLTHPAADPAPYIALFEAIMLTRMTGGHDGNRHSF
jgi:hypothetical protein